MVSSFLLAIVKTIHLRMPYLPRIPPPFGKPVAAAVTDRLGSV